jgi:DNA-binding MarR family transcriptional regulator
MGFVAAKELTTAGIAGLRHEIDLVSIVTIPPDSERRKQPMTRLETLHLEAFLPYRLSVLSNTVSSAIAAAYFANFGLSIPEWRVMAVLAANPGLSSAEVTARTAMDKVAVSRAVATLLAAGRLRRTTAPADRRRTHLALTKAGARVYAQVVPMALKYERQLVAPLSKSELATLDRILRVLLGRAVELGPAHVQ